MGERFARLAPELQQFHRLAGRHVLNGRVTVAAPSGWLARVLARWMGTPRCAAHDAPLRFELDAGATHETWARHFTGSVMTSCMRLRRGQIVEHLGPLRLAFDLLEEDGRLVMTLTSMDTWGLPWPRRLMPRIVARETGAAGALHFQVQAVLPVVGLVADYRGHLLLPATTPVSGGTIGA